MQRKPKLSRLNATPVATVKGHTQFRFSDTQTAWVPARLVQACPGGLAVPTWLVARDRWPVSWTQQVAS